MNRLARIVVILIFLLLCSTVLNPIMLKVQSQIIGLTWASNSITSSDAASKGFISNPASSETSARKFSNSDYNELHKITKKNCSISFLEKDSTIYITTSNIKDFKVKNMKQLGIDIAGSSKLLVNKDNTLPRNFSPKKLTNISSDKIKLEYTGLKLIPVTINALYTMADAAKKAGIKGFIVNSAYRSLSTQQQIFDANLNSFRKTSKTYKEAYEKTRLLVALPGNSEHHTGLALDIFSVNGRHRNDFEGTKEQVWLNKNLTRYGFIIRYPSDKTKETNSTYEPWHIRYVGPSLSRYMKEKNLCLEEFYSKILAGQVLENIESAFMQIKSDKRVFVEKTLISKTSLEKINETDSLLTLSL